MKPNITLFSYLTLGYAFLYMPIVILVIFSFNASKLVTVWSGFSTQWYTALFHNEPLLNAAGLSFKIAIINATVATVLGTLAALSLSRYKKFRGRTIFASVINMPLMIPDVIVGLSLLLFFVSLQQIFDWPTRGMTTITIAHITFSMVYVTVILYARMRVRDLAQEEAALDLGARPVTVFFRVTLPSILPAIIAGWLLAFTLSLDDLVISSFVSGPGATTLPMYIYSGVRLGVTPEINALGTLLIGGVSIIILLAGWLLQRKN